MALGVDAFSREEKVQHGQKDRRESIGNMKPWKDVKHPGTSCWGTTWQHGNMAMKGEIQILPM